MSPTNRSSEQLIDFAFRAGSRGKKIASGAMFQGIVQSFREGKVDKRYLRNFAIPAVGAFVISYLTSCMSPVDSNGHPTQFPDVVSGENQIDSLTPQAPAPDMSPILADAPLGFGVIDLHYDAEDSLNAQACSKIAQSPISYYQDSGSGMQLMHAPDMSVIGLTPMFAFDALDQSGTEVSQFCIATDTMDSPHILHNGEAGWVMLTDKLESPLSPDADQLFKVGDESYKPFGIFTKDGQRVEIGFGVGENGQLNGKAVIRVNDNFQPLDLGDAAQKFDGMMSLSPQFAVLDNQLREKLIDLGIDSNIINYAYHPETGLLGVDLGDGVFLNSDDTVTIHTQEGFVSADSDDVIYENGELKSVKGYELQNGVWVEAVIEEAQVVNPESILREEMKDWNFNSSDYTVTHDVDGRIVLQDNESKKVVYWDGAWDVDVMRAKILEVGECRKSDWVGIEGQGVGPTKDFDRWNNNFMIPLINLMRDELQRLKIPGSAASSFEFLGGPDNCWVVYPSYGGIKPLDALEKTTVFWMNNKSKLQHVPVFSPKMNDIALPLQ